MVKFIIHYFKVKNIIIKKLIKEIKYVVVILNCTWDASHQDQMVLTLKYVDISTALLKVDEYF